MSSGGEQLAWENRWQLERRVLLFMSPPLPRDRRPADGRPWVQLKWFRHWLAESQTGDQEKPKVPVPLNVEPWGKLHALPAGGDNTHYPRLYLAVASSGSAPADLLTTESLGRKDPALRSATARRAAASACSRMTAQWTAGAASNSFCANKQRTRGHSWTYTTAGRCGRHEGRRPDHGNCGPNLRKTRRHADADLDVSTVGE